MSGPQAGAVLAKVVTARLKDEVPFRYNSYLLRDVVKIMQSALAANTSKNYKTGLASYVRWFQNQGIPIQEAWPATDLLIAAWAASTCKKLAYQSFKMYMRGLKHYHVQLRLEVQGFESKFLRNYLMGLRKWVRNTTTKGKRWPITYPQLRFILKNLNPSKPADALRGFMYTVGFFGGPRPSEYLKKLISKATNFEEETLVHPIIRWVNVTLSGAYPRRSLSIRVLGAKFDPDDCGYLMNFVESGSDTCVIKWFSAHQRHRIRNNTKDDYQPLFAIKTDPVTVEQAKKWLKQDAKNAGLAHENYTSYSLRRGLATTLFLLGAKAETIKRMGRWRSDAYKKYVQIDPATTVLWRKRTRLSTFQHFGILTLDQASQLTLANVDDFYQSWGGSIRKKSGRRLAAN